MRLVASGSIFRMTEPMPVGAMLPQVMFATRWREWTYGRDDARYGLPLPPGWAVKVRGLTQLGATAEDWVFAIDVAMPRADTLHNTVHGVFPYTIGIVWQRLTARDGRPGSAWGGPASVGVPDPFGVSRIESTEPPPVVDA